MKLLYEGDKHLKALVELFEASVETRRDYAALYQVILCITLSGALYSTLSGITQHSIR